MANILMTVWPIETHISAFVSVGRSLRQHNHKVAFYTGACQSSRLAHEGFRVFPLEEAAPYADDSPGEAAKLNMSWREQRRMWHNFLLGSVPAQFRDLDRIWTKWRTDVLVSDITMWGPILLLHEIKQVPLAVFSHTAYCLLAGRENPAPGVSMARPHTAAGRFLARLLSAGINIWTSSIPRGANRIRRSHGLQPLPSTVMDFTGRMPLHVVASAPEFDYDRDDLPSSVRYVGSCLSDDVRRPAADWITAMRGDRPRVVVLEEVHYSADGALLKAAAKAFAGHFTEVILVAGSGRDLSTFDPGITSTNVRLVPWVPLHQAVKSADVVVAHGNSETVLAALGLGIPVVAVPHILEQPQVAWRLAASGAGLRLPMRRASPERLRLAVEGVLRDVMFSRHARRIGAALARAGGPDRAARLIEELHEAAYHLQQQAI